MRPPIVFHQKNLLFNPAFIEELMDKLDHESGSTTVKLHHTGSTLLRHLQERYNRTVIIHTSGGSHPEGRYSIPYKVLSDFILLKTELPCWKNYGFWTQTKVPTPLQQYFTRL